MDLDMFEVFNAVTAQTMIKVKSERVANFICDVMAMFGKVYDYAESE